MNPQTSSFIQDFWTDFETMKMNRFATSIRGHFDEQLESLRSQVVRMGDVTSEMISLSVEAAASGNQGISQRVVSMDDEVDKLEQRVILETVDMVMRESPVASDLRVLTSTLGVIGEIEKIADDAVKLARRSERLGRPVQGEFKTALAELSSLARNVLASAIRLYVSYDPTLAEEVIESDEIIDKRYAVARHRVIELIKSNPDATAEYLSTMEILHALEHIADRSVAIAKRLQLHYESSDSDIKDAI